MKKTLLVTSDFFPRVGGVATYYTKLCEGMDAEKIVVLNVGAEHRSALFNDTHFSSGHSVLDAESRNKNKQKFFLFSFLDPDFHRDDKKSNSGIEKHFRVILKKWLMFCPHWIQAVWLILHTVQKYHIELIWVGNILPFGTACLILKKLGLIKEYIVSVHGLDVNLAFERKPKVAMNILKNAKRITANSRYTKGLVVEKGIEDEKVKVVYPGVSTPLLHLSPSRGEKDVPPPEKGRRKEWVVLLTVARLVKRKGIDDVIRALPAVWEQYPNLVYKIVGEGPERESLERLARFVGARLITSVQFLGELSGEELERAYQGADIFIMTPKQIGSDVEGFGIVYLEANAYGLPVIGSRTGGVPEAVEDGVNGILVEPCDIQGITNAIVRVCADEDLRKRLGSQGQGRMQDFSWEKSVQELQSVMTIDK